MRYIADLHIHSPFSRATSKAGNLQGLAAWARVKGIHLLGTGDFTHPGWFSQLKEQLIPAEPGFYKLKNEAIPSPLPHATPVALPSRFLLTAEISSIYKRHGAVRKVHNLLLDTPVEEINLLSPVLGEAVARIREGRVIRTPGYDGEFGVIRVFTEGERADLAGQISLFAGKKITPSINRKPMEIQDRPAPRTIRIGAANIGLIGLDQALNKALTRQMQEETAVDFIFAAVMRENYVPATAAPIYREALRAEYRRRQGIEGAAPGGLTIRVLGSGCVTCNKLSAMLFEALQKFALAADMESVHDLDEIWRFGVTKTPALIINGKVKCAGRMPSPAEVEEWVKEESEK